MKKLILTTSIFLVCTTALFSQSQVIFNKTNSETYIIKFENGGNVIKNQIITKLATAYNKPVSSVQLIFTFDQKRQILRRSNRLEFKVSMNNITLNGDKMYRGFDVGKTLIPNKISFTLNWLNGNNLINSYTFNDVAVSGNYVQLVDMTATDSLQADNYKIKLVNKIFNYSVQNQQNFNRETELIDTYYDENIVARNKLRKLNSFNINENHLKNLDNLNDLYSLRDTAKYFIGYTTNVKNKVFYKNLPINTYDPGGLKNKLSQITNKANRLRNICIDIIENFDRIYYERGLEMLAQHKPSRADFFFNKSLEINPNFAPSHFQLARLYYNNGHLDKAVNKVFEIRGMNPNTETKLQTVELARGIYGDLILDAVEFNNRNNFDDAFAALTRAAEICDRFPEVHCRQSMDIEFSRAVNGRYHLILRDIDTQFRNNNLREAEKIIGIGLEYAYKNKTFIPDNKEVADRISYLYNRYIENGNKLNYQSQFTAAINEFDNAARVCNGYKEIKCTNLLNKGYADARNGTYNSYINQAETNFRNGNDANADNYIKKAISYREKYELKQNAKEDRLFLDIKQSIYASLIDTGKQFSDAGNYKKALSKFDAAFELEKSYGLRSNSNLKNYTTNSAKKLINIVISDGEKKVKVNNLSKAREIYKEAKRISAKYSLEKDYATAGKLKGLKSKIFERECINAQNTYDNYEKEALDLIILKKYIEADNKINKAFSHSESYSQCEIDTRKLQERKDYISPAVKYLKQLISINEYIKRNNFKTATTEYMSAEEYYNVQNLKNYGITHIQLFDFIQSSYTGYIIYGVGFYNHNKEFEKALDLLRELSRRKAKKKYTKEAQTVLGTDLASKDYEESPNANYKSNIAKYIGGDKFLKYFKKAYKKQWKRLKK